MGCGVAVGIGEGGMDMGMGEVEVWLRGIGEGSDAFEETMQRASSAEMVEVEYDSAVFGCD